MQGTVKYSEEFITPTGLKRWVGLELPFEDTIHSPIDKLEEAMSKVHAFATQSGITPDKSHITPDEQLSTIQIEKEPEIGITVSQILECNDLTVLEASYKWTTKGKPELERAYLLRKDQLTKKQ